MSRGPVGLRSTQLWRRYAQSTFTRLNVDTECSECGTPLIQYDQRCRNCGAPHPLHGQESSERSNAIWLFLAVAIPMLWNAVRWCLEVECWEWLSP